MTHTSRNFFLLFICFGLFFLQGCEEIPTDVGSGFISPDDTLNVRLLDSQADTIALLSSPYKKAFSNFITPFLLVGKSNGVEASSLLRFNNLPANFAGANVTSAKLILKYSNYYYTDSLGTIDFNIHRLNQNYTFSTVTSDSISKSSYDPTPVGNFSGNPVDTATVVISLDNEMVKDWLEFAADPKYPVGNFGMIFVPNGNSNAIKGFVSTNGTVVAETPYVEIVIKGNDKDDTITLNTSESNFIADGNLNDLMPDRITLQSGIAIQNFFRFDLSKLPENVIINEARLEMYLDTNSSYFFRTSERRFVANLITDSTTFADTITVINSQILGDKYVLQFNPIAQFWNAGIFANQGLALSNLSKRVNLDKFVFYSPTFSDVSKRPRLRITYTIRN